MRQTMRESEYSFLMFNGHPGICLDCGAVTESGIERDAEGRRCEACGALQVMGLEQGLISGRLVLTSGEEAEDPDPLVDRMDREIEVRR